MKGSALYESESKLLKAADLAGREHELKIESVEVVKFTDGDKLGVRFIGRQKGLALNKTNYSVIANALTDETDNWIGKSIIIYPTVTDYQGTPTPCIRVRPVLEKADFKDDTIPW